MKQLLLFTFSVLLLCSCGVMQKTSKTISRTTDSTSKKSSALVDLKKNDSSGTSTATKNEKASSDSIFKKTTVIKEIISDEFDFAGTDTTDSQGDKDKINHDDYLPVICCDTLDSKGPSNTRIRPGWLSFKNVSKKKVPFDLGNRGRRWTIRETTITEEGRISKAEDRSQVNQQTTKASSVDSSASSTSEEVSLNKNESERNTSKKRSIILLSLSAFILWSALLIFLYRKYKDRIPFLRKT